MRQHSLLDDTTTRVVLHTTHRFGALHLGHESVGWGVTWPGEKSTSTWPRKRVKHHTEACQAPHGRLRKRLTPSCHSSSLCKRTGLDHWPDLHRPCSPPPTFCGSHPRSEGQTDSLAMHFLCPAVLCIPRSTHAQGSTLTHEINVNTTSPPSQRWLTWTLPHCQIMVRVTHFPRAA